MTTSTQPDTAEWYRELRQKARDLDMTLVVAVLPTGAENGSWYELDLNEDTGQDDLRQTLGKVERYLERAATEHAPG